MRTIKFSWSLTRSEICNRYLIIMAPLDRKNRFLKFNEAFHLIYHKKPLHSIERSGKKKVEIRGVEPLTS